MLLQSNDPQAKPTSLTSVQQGQAAVVRLLPALPSAFPAGSVTGLRARGGFEVDIAWQHGKLQRAVVRAKASGPLTLIYSDKKAEITAVAGRQYVFDADLKPIAK
jgi:alpha-L-fucosidase 2